MTSALETEFLAAVHEHRACCGTIEAQRIAIRNMIAKRRDQLAEAVATHKSADLLIGEITLLLACKATGLIP